MLTLLQKHTFVQSVGNHFRFKLSHATECPWKWGFLQVKKWKNMLQKTILKKEHICTMATIQPFAFQIFLMNLRFRFNHDFPSCIIIPYTIPPVESLPETGCLLSDRWFGQCILVSSKRQTTFLMSAAQQALEKSTLCGCRVLEK